MIDYVRDNSPQARVHRMVRQHEGFFIMPQSELVEYLLEVIDLQDAHNYPPLREVSEILYEMPHAWMEFILANYCAEDVIVGTSERDDLWDNIWDNPLHESFLNDLPFRVQGVIDSVFQDYIDMYLGDPDGSVEDFLSVLQEEQPEPTREHIEKFREYVCELDPADILELGEDWLRPVFTYEEATTQMESDFLGWVQNAYPGEDFEDTSVQIDHWYCVGADLASHLILEREVVLEALGEFWWGLIGTYPGDLENNPILQEIACRLGFTKFQGAYPLFSLSLQDLEDRFPEYHFVEDNLHEVISWIEDNETTPEQFDEILSEAVQAVMEPEDEE